MMEAVRTSETSVDNHFTRQYIPEDNSEHHTHHRENLKSHDVCDVSKITKQINTPNNNNPTIKQSQPTGFARLKIVPPTNNFEPQPF
jgi:hypothetical protein